VFFRCDTVPLRPAPRSRADAYHGGSQHCRRLPSVPEALRLSLGTGRLVSCSERRNASHARLRPRVSGLSLHPCSPSVQYRLRTKDASGRLKEFRSIPDRRRPSRFPDRDKRPTGRVTTPQGSRAVHPFREELTVKRHARSPVGTLPGSAESRTRS